MTSTITAEVVNIQAVTPDEAPLLAPFGDPVSRTEVHRAVSGIADRILATTDVKRSDRLWPADYMVFATNSMGFGYGAIGTAIFLKRALGELPPNVSEWLRAQQLSIEDYPPGINVGLSGIAYGFLQLGMLDEAVDAINLAAKSPLLFREATFFHGIAGYGWTSLEFAKRFSGQDYMDAAIRAGDFLAVSAETDRAGVFWNGQGTRGVSLGAAFGNSGIALFLLQLYEATGDHAYRELAVRAIDFDLSHGRLSDFDARWPSTTLEDGTRPYWLNGTAGVGACAIRFYEVTGESRFLQWARRAVNGCFNIFTVAPGQYEGMSGIGEFLIDMHRITGDSTFLRLAEDTVAAIMCFRIERENGTAFAGRRLARMCSDFATGSAGIGLFLARWLEPHPRLLHDSFSLESLRCADAGPI
jgi:hypothetical protein